MNLNDNWIFSKFKLCENNLWCNLVVLSWIPSFSLEMNLLMKIFSKKKIDSFNCVVIFDAIKSINLL